MPVDPTTLSFSASSDHSTNNPDGTPKVRSYKLQLLQSGQTVRESNLGKPTPTGGTITVSLVDKLVGLGSGPFNYRVGTEGSNNQVTWSSNAADTITRSGSTGVPAAPGQPTVA